MLVCSKECFSKLKQELIEDIEKDSKDSEQRKTFGTDLIHALEWGRYILRFALYLRYRLSSLRYHYSLQYDIAHDYLHEASYKIGKSSILSDIYVEPEIENAFMHKVVEIFAKNQDVNL